MLHVPKLTTGLRISQRPDRLLAVSVNEDDNQMSSLLNISGGFSNNLDFKAIVSSDGLA